MSQLRVGVALCITANGLRIGDVADLSTKVQ